MDPPDDNVGLPVTEAVQVPPEKNHKQRLQEMIRRYFQMITVGCGNSSCPNHYCASSSQFKYAAKPDSNTAALEAVRLVKEKALLECVPAVVNDVGLSYRLLKDTIERCRLECSWSEMIKLIGVSFSDIDIMMRSYRTDMPDQKTSLCLDLTAVRQTYGELFSLPASEDIVPAIVNALITLSTELSRRLQQGLCDIRLLNVIYQVFELPCLDSPELIERAYPLFLGAVVRLNLAAQVQLVQSWSKQGADYLRRIMVSLQQLVTIKIVEQSEMWSSRRLLNDDESIICAVKVMHWIYYASLLGGKRDPVDVVDLEDSYRKEMKKKMLEDIETATQLSPSGRTSKSSLDSDELATALHIKPINCREPLIPTKEFINESVNDTLDMDQDFTFYKAQIGKFTFIKHSFLLSTATKSLVMYYDNRIRMHEERQSALVNSIFNRQPPNPYLKLKVKRNDLITDTLIALSMVFVANPEDLKKQLYVEFEGEQGIDEGGVSKEFFQLLTEQIFNPDYGMFTYNVDSHMFWFNMDSYENEEQFRLMGILLGLAIYNHIILNVQFPPVVYRKLMGKRGTFEDMQSSHPVLHSSLSQLLSYDGNVEEDFMVTFTLGRRNMFGENVIHPLLEGGANVTVTNRNREDFCHTYADFLLNKSVEKQFGAFYQGFHMVVDESPLEALFSAEEIEELVCGSNDWDIDALEATTEYDGFDSNSPTIRHFWQIIHSMNVDEQKKFLQFTTGSDRVPVGGLSKLKLVIAKNGPDSDRLPTSHTCFNVLLLPDYNNYDKLRNRLLLAITHAQGFGML